MDAESDPMKTVELALGENAELRYLRSEQAEQNNKLGEGEEAAREGTR